MSRLTQAQVDAYIEADKRVAASRVGPRWQLSGQDFASLTLRLERGAVSEGIVMAVVNRSVPRHWTFKLVWEKEEVLLWHFCAPPQRHRNPPNRPADFPVEVRALEHEHIWIEGFRCRNARPLPGVAAISHEEALTRFLVNAHIVWDGRYLDPPAGEQITMRL